MSYRFDTQLVPSGYHFGNRGLGVTGAQVPSSGDNGPGFIYNDLNLPADANKEYYARIETFPSVGVFQPAEDTSFTYTGPNTSFVYRLFEDGVDKGTSTVTLSDTSSVTLAMTEPSDVWAITSSIQSQVLSASLGWSESSDTFSMAASVFVTPAGSLQWTEQSDVHTSSASFVASASVNWVESDDTDYVVVSVLSITRTGVLSWSEEVDSSSISAALTFVSSSQWVEDSDQASVSITLGNISDIHLTARSDRFIAVPMGDTTQIDRVRGDTYADVFKIKHAVTKKTINLTNCTFRLTLSSERNTVLDDDKLFILNGVVEDTAKGIVEFHPSSEDVDKVGYFFYDLQMIDSYGQLHTLINDATYQYL